MSYSGTSWSQSTPMSLSANQSMEDQMLSVTQQEWLRLLLLPYHHRKSFKQEDKFIWWCANYRTSKQRFSEYWSHITFVLPISNRIQFISLLLLCTSLQNKDFCLAFIQMHRIKLGWCQDSIQWKSYWAQKFGMTNSICPMGGVNSSKLGAGLQIRIVFYFLEWLFLHQILCLTTR